MCARVCVCVFCLFAGQYYWFIGRVIAASLSCVWLVLLDRQRLLHCSTSLEAVCVFVWGQWETVCKEKNRAFFTHVVILVSTLNREDACVCGCTHVCEWVCGGVCLKRAVVSHVCPCSQSCKHIEPWSASVGVRKTVNVCVHACVVSHVSTFNHDTMLWCCVCTRVRRGEGYCCYVVVKMDGSGSGH